MHSLQFEHKSILSSESGNLHNLESRPKWMGQLGLYRLCPLWKWCNARHIKRIGMERVSTICHSWRVIAWQRVVQMPALKSAIITISAVAHLGNKPYSMSRLFKSCRWFYVTWWYLCWQTMLHWWTWVTIQSLQTLRHNGYLSLGQPNPIAWFAWIK